VLPHRDTSSLGIARFNGGDDLCVLLVGVTDHALDLRRVRDEVSDTDLYIHHGRRDGLRMSQVADHQVEATVGEPVTDAGLPAGRNQIAYRSVNLSARHRRKAHPDGIPERLQRRVQPGPVLGTQSLRRQCSRARFDDR